jgi:hypothetical protein
MSTLQAFFLGLFVGWTPALLLLAVLLMRATESKHHEP